MHAEYNEARNGYLIEERGGHKIVVSKEGDTSGEVTHYRWAHDAANWIDEQDPPEGRKGKK